MNAKEQVLFIGACGYNYSTNGGEIAKSRIINQYLKRNFKVHTVDTYWEKKNIVQGIINLSFGRLIKFFKILYWSRKSSQIVLCSSYATYLKPIKIAHRLDRVFMFGIGGRVPQILLEQVDDVNMLNELKGIIVESTNMVEEFKAKGVTSAKYAPNFKCIPYYSEPFFVYDTCLKLFYIGKICEEKGCLDLVRAVKELNDDGIHCNLTFYGDVDKDFAIDKMLSDYIIYGGYLDLVEDLSSYEMLRKYDLFVFPSKWDGEGFAGALIDAMSLGKPIIASKHNAIPYIVKDNVTGLLFEKGNVSELKEKIIYFYENRSQLDVFGKSSLNEARKYDVEEVLNSLLGADL